MSVPRRAAQSGEFYFKQSSGEGEGAGGGAGALNVCCEILVRFVSHNPTPPPNNHPSLHLHGPCWLYLINRGADAKALIDAATCAGA